MLGDLDSISLGDVLITLVYVRELVHLRDILVPLKDELLIVCFLAVSLASAVLINNLKNTKMSKHK